MRFLEVFAHVCSCGDPLWEVIFADGTKDSAHYGYLSRFTEGQVRQLIEENWPKEVVR